MRTHGIVAFVITLVVLGGLSVPLATRTGAQPPPAGLPALVGTVITGRWAREGNFKVKVVSLDPAGFWANVVTPGGVTADVVKDKPFFVPWGQVEWIQEGS
jgi:hypothetical protein